MRDILVRLRADAGQLTLATLIQEREAAACEMERLRSQLESKVSVAATPAPSKTARPPPVRATVEMSALHPNALLRLSDVSTLLGISRSTIYNWMSNGWKRSSLPCSVKA